MKTFEEMVSVRIVGVTQPVVDEIPDSEGLISYQARVSNPKNQSNYKTASRLLDYCMRHQHWSVFEMANVVVEIKAPRDISRQILRHRSANFQELCVSEGTRITTETDSGRSKKVNIEDLWKRFNSSYWKRSQNLVRVFDEKTKLLIPAKIKEVFKTGEKETFKLTLDDGKQIVCTDEHKFLCFDGFKRLKDMTEEDFVATNGVPLYQDREWLKNAKESSIESGTGLQGIADMAKISPHTIRKWLKIHKLQFTRKEVSSYNPIWNKGLPKELQPAFRRVWTEEQRENRRKVAKKGPECNLYKNGNTENRTWRKLVADFCVAYKQELLINQNWRCPVSGRSLTMENSAVDHVQPVGLRPDLAFDKSNLAVLHKEAHNEKTAKEISMFKQTVSYKKVKSIEYVGIKQTYDMEIEHIDHNYVANGIVTHNSQRYSAVDDFVVREARLQDETNRQNSIETDDEELKEWWYEAQEEALSVCQQVYTAALEKGIAKECARVVLPEGNTMSTLYMNATVRTWYHYATLRASPETQKEHRLVAIMVMEELKKYFPNVFDGEQ